MSPEASTVGDDQSVEEPRRELNEAREQQRASTEILSVISRSPTDVQPVFDAIVANAARLCDAAFSAVVQFRDGLLHLVAVNKMSAEETAAYHTVFPRSPNRGFIIGRAFVDGRPVQVADIEADPLYDPQTLRILKAAAPYRTYLGVPIMRDGVPIGAIGCGRREVKPFTDAQIALVKTFADQAVIAIENVRLFNELRQSLEQQTATSDVLNVISRSPTNAQPVFDIIGERAEKLCQAQISVVSMVDGEVIRMVAIHGVTGVEAVQALFPMRRDDATVTARAIRTGAVVHVPDLPADPQYENKDAAQASRSRGCLCVPMVREGQVIGAIFVARTEPGFFADAHVDLLKTFADQAVIAIENARLFEEVQVRTCEIGESLEYQTATSEVLGVISRSPSQLQPVFDFIAHSASRLCGDEYAIVTRYDGVNVHLVAQHNPRSGTSAEVEKFYPVPAARSSLVGARAAFTGSVIHIPDIEAETYEASDLERHRRISARALIGVPMIHQGRPIGSIAVSRATPGPFSRRQIDVLQTFADQAVIAIENVRLFEEVQARTRELQKTLEYQTATSDVLNVISRSKFDLQPVLDTIAEGAARLCGGLMGGVFRYDGELMHLGAMINFAPGGEQTWRGVYPRPATHDTATGRAILEKTVVIVPDVEADARAEWAREVARKGGYRSAMAVPMLREGLPIGAIMVARVEPGSFPETHIDLLKTFADQAVIAIENTRLFEEVQARNRDLTEALEQQTATSEVLRAISRPQTDAEPVFDIIAASALRLCGAGYGQVALYDGELLHMIAFHNVSAEGVEALRRRFPAVADHGSAMGRAIHSRSVVQIPDILADPTYAFKTEVQTMGARSLLVVPMLAKGGPIGAIAVGRRECGLFSDNQIELLKTFADQAVIAIQNRRLFEEVQARNRDLTALGEVGRAVSSTLDLRIVLKTIVDRAVNLSGTDGGSIFYYREELGKFELGETSGLEEEVVAGFRKLDISAKGTGLGESISKRQPLQIPDITKRPSNPLRDAAIDAGLRASLIVPLISSEGPLGTLVLQRRQPGDFPQAVISLMQAFADQSAIALENARLFEEIARKSRELEIASQHKSQFVANMSHELRTPLAAILGYAELIQEGFYGPLPEKSMDALTRIRSNGKHLLGLINTVLDIAKIESGQFRLNIGEYALENVVETVRAATESLAETKKLSLKTDVAERLPVGLGDEQRLTQVLLNLVGNAIKFTDAGEIRITAAAENGHFAIAVTDTGPGIPPEEQKRVFEQFHQVDSSNTKAKGGTGLGLAIAKQIVEMHGGRVWVESTLGKGATFQISLPIHLETRNGAA